MLAIGEFIAKPSTVAQKIAVDVVIVAIDDAAHRACVLTDVGVAPKPAVHAYGRGKLLVPLAGIVALQGLVREHAGRADLDEVAAELIFQHTIHVTAEKHRIPRGKGIQIVAARVVTVVAHATVALDAPVHLMIYQRAEILVAKRALLELVAAVGMACHHRHVLQMTLAAFITHRTVMRMIQHQAFDDGGAECDRLRMVDRDVCALGGRRHAGHHNLSLSIMLVLELLDRTLAAGADGPECRVPAEIGQIQPRRQTAMKQILFRLHLIRFSVNMNRCHGYLPSTISMDIVFHECAARNHRGNASLRFPVPLQRRARVRKMWRRDPTSWLEMPAFRDRPAAHCRLPWTSESALPNAARS